jgi:hypothetical protein
VARACCQREPAKRPSFQSIAETLNTLFADDADPRPLVRIKDRKVPPDVEQHQKHPGLTTTLCSHHLASLLLCALTIPAPPIVLW